MKKFFTYLMIILLVFTSSNWVFVSAETIDELEKEIEELEKEEEKLKDEQSKLDGEKSETEQKKEENLNKQEEVKKEIAALEQQLLETEASITTKESEISETSNEVIRLTTRVDVLETAINKLELEIELLQEDIIELKDKIDKREQLLMDRLRNIQKNGELRYLEVVLGSTSFADFIGRLSAVNVMMEQDQVIMDTLSSDREELEDKKGKVEKNKKDVIVNKEEVESNKEEVETKKLNLEQQKKDLVVLQDQLDEQKQEQQDLMAQLEHEHDELDEIQLSIEEEQQLIIAEVNAKQKAIEMAKRKKEELEQLKTPAPPEPPRTGNPNGIFIHPAHGETTSPFGMRWHPIFNDYRMHNGIDYGVPTGTPLLAPADGVVSYAGWLGGFGNLIMVSHYINGQSYTTLMAHLSSVDVTVGQEVSVGQVIGATGNTGNSTGPHLHFEVHPDGYHNPVDPAPYIK